MKIILFILREETEAGGDSQTTWGCSFTFIVVFIYVCKINKKNTKGKKNLCPPLL